MPGRSGRSGNDGGCDGLHESREQSLRQGLPTGGSGRLSRFTLLLILPAIVGCSYSAIDGGAAHNGVVTVQDMFTSSHLLETADGVVLFDAGYRAGRVESVLADRGFGPGDVTDIFLTHGHGDHVAGLERFPGARVLALAAEAELVAEESGVEVTEPLTAGEVRTVGGFPVEVFSVPGHTPGNAVYLVDGVLLLGDSAFATRDGELISTPANYSDDPDLLDTSLRALADELAPRSSDVEWLVPSHTGALEGIQALLEF